MQYLGTIITFFAPGLIAVCIEEYIRKKANEQHEEISFKKAFFSWACYSYLITLCIGTIKYVEGWGSWLYADTINQVSNVVKYGALSIFFAISFVVIHNMRPLLSIFSSVYPSQSTLKKCKNSNIRLKTSEKYFYVFISSCASLLVLFFWTKGNYKIYDFNMGTIAFSYQYGFICRGLIGTCINLFANALGVSVSAHLIEQIFFIITILLIVVLIMFIFGTGIRADRLFDADVAQKHHAVCQKVVGKEYRLCALKMGVARHYRGFVFLGFFDERFGGAFEHSDERIGFAAQIQP